MRYNAPWVNTNAMDEFKSTGLFAKFENQALKDEIQAYYAHFTWVFPQGANRDDPSFQLQNSLISNGYSYLDVAALDDPVQVLLSDPTCIAILKNIIDESTFQSNQAAFMLE